MFGIQGPGIIEVIKNSEFGNKEKLVKIKKEEVVVVSVIGSSTYHEEKTCKRAFRLILDSFGAPSLFKEHNGKLKTTKTPSAKRQDHAQDISATNEELANVDNNKSNVQENGKKESKISADRDGVKLDQNSELNLGLIDGFYTKDEHILFLHLRGAFDPKSLLAEWKKINSDDKSHEMGFSQIWAKIKTKFCRSLLLLFSLSHVVLVSNTGNFFDSSYIQLFRILDTVRHEVLPHASKLLGKIDGMPKQWRDHARLCSPRILFLFQVDSGQPLRISEELPLVDPIKDQQYKLEDEIYHILRKCRIVTNISANSLFAIPSTQEYVFIYDQGVQEPEMRDDPLSKLNHLTISFCEKMSSSFLDPALSDYKSAAKLSFASTFPTIYSTNASKRLCEQRRTYRDVLTDFREFITSHARLALESGFDDDSKHVAEHKHFFVLPTFNTWRKAFGTLSHYFVHENHSDHRAREALSLIYQFNNVDTEYLESQCAKAFPKAYSLYLKNLPEIYPEKMHKAKVSHAVESYLKVSRGPGVRPWVTKLIEKCDRYWKNGRQQCEARSLHEHTCCHALHRFRVEDHLEVIPLPVMDESLPEKEHSTGLRILSYCNCGHRQGSRDEPFTIREANFSFYERLAQDCCDRLDRVEFPYFQPPLDSKDRKAIDPQEMLLIYQQKLLGLLHHGKFEPVSEELEDELRQGPSLQFDNENEDEENENMQQNQNANQPENQNAKEENVDKAAVIEADEAQTNADDKDSDVHSEKSNISNPVTGGTKPNVAIPASVHPRDDRHPELENKSWRKAVIKTSIEPDFLPRTELENEYIYKRIRERKALAETEMVEVSRNTGESKHVTNSSSPSEKKEVPKENQSESVRSVNTIDNHNKIVQLSEVFKSEIKKVEEEQNEWLKWSGYEPKSSNICLPSGAPSISPNIKAFKETFYESFDLPMKTMALSMRFQPCWEQRSKRLPDHTVLWVNDYTKRRRFLLQDSPFSSADYPQDDSSQYSETFQKLCAELMQNEGGPHPSRICSNSSGANTNSKHFSSSREPTFTEVKESEWLEPLSDQVIDPSTVKDPGIFLDKLAESEIQSEHSVAWLLDDSLVIPSDINHFGYSVVHPVQCTSDSAQQLQHEGVIELETNAADSKVEGNSQALKDLQSPETTDVPVHISHAIDLTHDHVLKESQDNIVESTKQDLVNALGDLKLSEAEEPNAVNALDNVVQEQDKVDTVDDVKLSEDLEQDNVAPTVEVLSFEATNEHNNRDANPSPCLENAGESEENGVTAETTISSSEEIAASEPTQQEQKTEVTPSPPRESEATSSAQEELVDDTTMQYLPGMLHSRSLHGLLPLFSSWSLICLGSSSLYTHTSGITHQPGFLAGSSTLLPWDKMVKAEAGVSKPIPRLIRGRKPTGRARRITDEFNVKVFIGVEYECKRGHRFLLESPDRILQTNMNSNQHGPPNLKEAANVVASSDMPLYYRCPCKESRDGSIMIAQLLRIHVITPKAPVHVTLNPRVQPGPSPCPIFHPGNIEPVKLTPSSYWILRLPYCYVGDDQVYVPSRDVARYNGRLLKGLYDVESMSPDETQTWELQNNSIS